MHSSHRLGGLFVVFVAFAAGPALAGKYDDAFFVRKDATAVAMLQDRAACTDEALTLDIDQPRGYSNPDYGVLTAMGAALQQGDMGADVRKAVRKVVMIKCMERRGWTEAVVVGEAAKALRKVSLKNPGPLDAWLKANEPAPAEPAAPAPSLPPSPATAASAAEAPTAPSALPPPAAPPAPAPAGTPG